MKSGDVIVVSTNIHIYIYVYMHAMIGVAPINCKMLRTKTG